MSNDTLLKAIKIGASIAIPALFLAGKYHIDKFDNIEYQNNFAKTAGYLFYGVVGICSSQMFLNKSNIEEIFNYNTLLYPLLSTSLLHLYMNEKSIMQIENHDKKLMISVNFIIILLSILENQNIDISKRPISQVAKKFC